MPAWIHDRAKHIQRKNPEMPESQAFAIATQQAHKLGKTPKGYGTKEGKAEARAKYDKPRSEYRKTADRVKKAAAIIAIQKRANVMMGYPSQGAPASPMAVPQAKPAPAPPVIPIASAQGAPPATLPRAASGPGPMLKQGGVLPEFLDKPRRGERLDPRGEDFAKNRAFGKSVGLGGMPIGMAGALAGGLIGGSRGSFPKALAGATGGALLGAGLGTAASFPMHLKRERQLQALRAAREAKKRPPGTVSLSRREAAAYEREFGPARRGRISGSDVVVSEPIRKTASDAMLSAFFDELQQIEMEKQAGLLEPRFAGQAPSKLQLVARKVAKKFGWTPSAYVKKFSGPATGAVTKAEAEATQLAMARHAHKKGLAVDPSWVEKIKAQEALEAQAKRQAARPRIPEAVAPAAGPRAKRKGILQEIMSDPEYQARVRKTVQEISGVPAAVPA